MRRIIPILLFLAGMPVVANAAEPNFYEKEIGSMKDCDAIFTATTPNWKNRPEFITRNLSGGRKQVVQCLPDGVVELYCDPQNRHSMAAVLEGETLPACSKITPGIKVRNVDTLIAR